MGLLVDGKWVDQWHDTKTTTGKFERPETTFRNKLGDANHPFEPGRYHLYVSYACPWAHRTLIFRALKGLTDAISLSVVNPLMGEEGWELAPGADPINDANCLHEVYTRANPKYTGRVTVPILWDKHRHTIVNNESAEIIRMFNDVGPSGDDYCPEKLRPQIDEINEFVYDNINNGVYKAGFATTQEAYDEAVSSLFAALDKIEDRLMTQQYLVDNTLTEADWRLFTTLVRFDPVYVGHFKCNLKQIRNYSNLSAYLKKLYAVEGIAKTTHIDHIKQHYYQSHKQINPTGIVPAGPKLDLD